MNLDCAFLIDVMIFSLIKNEIYTRKKLFKNYHCILFEEILKKHHTHTINEYYHLNFNKFHLLGKMQDHLVLTLRFIPCNFAGNNGALTSILDFYSFPQNTFYGLTLVSR